MPSLPHVIIHDDAPSAAFVRASQAHDVPALMACTTPDVVLRSPITGSFAFRGREQVAAVMEDVYAVLADAVYDGDVGDGRTRALRGTATIGGLEVHEIVLLELDHEGLVESMEIFMRPMPALLAVAAALGPRVAARNGRARALATRMMIAPLAFATRHGERVGSSLARPRP